MDAWGLTGPLQGKTTGGMKALLLPLYIVKLVYLKEIKRPLMQDGAF